MKNASTPPSSEGFLSRWSRLKRESGPDPASAEGLPSTSAEVDERTDPSIAAAASPTSSTMVKSSSNQSPAPTPAAPPLPAIDTLTFESDYSAFFQPQVADDLRRAAVKKLFADPHFNVMDGLDVYIDDYSKPDPLPEGWLEKIAHARDLIDHPSNRKPAEEEVPVEADTGFEVDTGASADPQAVDAIEDNSIAAVDAVQSNTLADAPIPRSDATTES